MVSLSLKNVIGSDLSQGDQYMLVDNDTEVFTK